MPGRLFLTRPIGQVIQALGLSDTDAPDAYDTPPRHNIAPGQDVVAFDGHQLSAYRWGIIPVGRKNARGRPVMETIINARSETLFDKTAFEGVGRAVIPVDGWYEWTGEKRRKTAWAISDVTNGLLYFAAITDVWTAPGGLSVPQIAAVTCAPNKDVADIHHRMGVLLEPESVPAWLGEDLEAAKALMVPWPEGRLRIAAATDVDWNAP